MTSTSDRRRGFATIQDVADAAGVSRAAVSKVIGNAYGVSDAMRRKVESAMVDLDYRPSAMARALRGRSSTIGVEAPDVTNPFLAQLLRGAMRTLEASSYQVIVAPALRINAERAQAIDALVDRRVDGILAVSPLATTERLERIASRIPLVMLADHGGGPTHDTVTSNDAAGANLAMQHLLDLGHRRIVHLTIREALSSNSAESPHAVRYSAYRAKMIAAGLTPQVVTVSNDDDAYAVAGALLDFVDDRPTAILAGHDVLAMHALAARIDRGFPPSKASIAGFDGIDIVKHPAMSITTIDQRGEFLGSEAARLLLERIEGRTEAVHLEIAPDLIIGSSTAPVA